MANNNDTPTISRVYGRVVDQLKDREQKGFIEYGQTMDRNDLSLIEWLQNLQEEMLDAAVYIEKLKQEVQYQEYELGNLRVESDDCTKCIPGVCACEAFEEKHVLNMPHLEFRQGVCLRTGADLAYNEEESDKRMNVIGQNGNTGEHYKTTSTANIESCGACEYYCIGGCKYDRSQ